MQVTESSQPQDEEIRRLHETLALAASEAKDSGRALLAVVRKLCTVFGWAFGEAWVPSRDGSVLKPGPAWPRANASYAAFRAASRRLGFLPGGGLPGKVWRERKPIWLEDIEQAPSSGFSRQAIALKTGFKAAVALPILAGADVIAVIVLYRAQVAPHYDALLEGLTSTLAPLGPVIARKQVEVELAVREQQQKAVARLGQQALAEPTELDGLMKEAVRLASATLGVGYCKLLEVTDGGRFTLRAGIGWKQKELEVDGSQAGYTLLNSEAVIVQDLDRERRFVPSSLLREHGIVSGLSVLIHGAPLPFGVLPAHAQQRRTFTPDDVHFLQAVANVISAAIQRSRAEQALERHQKQLETLVEQRTTELEQSHERLRTAERLASIGTLAAGLGHDLGNTILPILCRLDALEATSLSDSAREDLFAVRQAVDYLRQLSRGLRLFALDPESDTAGVTILKDWWEDVSPLLRNALPERITLKGDFHGALPPVAVPPHRLSQAFLNLVANSAEAIEGDGGVFVWAEALTQSGFVRIGVADNGKGMTPDVRRHSLDPFFTTKKRGLSTGLGLALVHAIAKSCGGSVEIDSSKGAGTSILLSLPVAEITWDAPELKPHDRVAAVSLQDPRMRAYAELLLRSTGIEVQTCENGDPGDTHVWITDVSEAAFERARAYLDEDPRRRVVFSGDEPVAARHPGFVFVNPRGGSAAMRRSLRAVVFQLLEKDA